MTAIIHVRSVSFKVFFLISFFDVSVSANKKEKKYFVSPTNFAC
jgi:hypothetical protein